MTSLPPILTMKEIKKGIAATIEGYEDKIKKITLFGSYARGDANPFSDVDLIVDGKFDSYLDFIEFSEDARTVFMVFYGVEVDIFQEQEVIDNTEFSESIKKEGIVIYER